MLLQTLVDEYPVIERIAYYGKTGSRSKLALTHSDFGNDLVSTRFCTRLQLIGS